MSEEMAMFSGHGIRVDSAQPQQHEITVDNHRQHIDELLEVIKGANGMPVLLVTSSDGRLSAIAMNGLQNMVPKTNHEVNGSSTEEEFKQYEKTKEKKTQDFRAWLLLVISLVATVTFTAGLTPPGGFWAEDKAADMDGKGGHVAGTSVMRDKFPDRYKYFQGCNTGAFFLSLITIGTLAGNVDNRRISLYRNYAFPFLVCFCFLCLGGSYIAGTCDGNDGGFLITIAFANVLLFMAIHWVPTWFRSRPSVQRAPDTKNSPGTPVNVTEESTIKQWQSLVKKLGRANRLKESKMGC